MRDGKFIKVDGVEVNVAWVTAMTRDEFVADPQVNRLFYRIKESDRATALSTIYQSVTGKKGRSGAKPPPPPVTEPVTDPIKEESTLTNDAKGE